MIHYKGHLAGDFREYIPRGRAVPVFSGPFPHTSFSRLTPPVLDPLVSVSYVVFVLSHVLVSSFHVGPSSSAMPPCVSHPGLFQCLVVSGTFLVFCSLLFSLICALLLSVLCFSPLCCHSFFCPRDSFWFIWFSRVLYRSALFYKLAFRPAFVCCLHLGPHHVFQTVIVRTTKK